MPDFSHSGTNALMLASSGTWGSANASVATTNNCACGSLHSARSQQITVYGSTACNTSAAASMTCNAATLPLMGVATGTACFISAASGTCVVPTASCVSSLPSFVVDAGCAVGVASANSCLVWPVGMQPTWSARPCLDLGAVLCAPHHAADSAYPSVRIPVEEIFGDPRDTWREFLDAEDWAKSKKKFWNLFSSLDEPLSQANGAISYLAAIGNTRSASPISILSMGKRWEDTERLELSARDIQWIIDNAVRELDIRNVASSLEAIVLVHQVLSNGISQRARRRIVSKEPASPLTRTSVRDRVMNLSIHTGVSPPAVASERPALRWAFVLFTNPQQVQDEKIQRQTDSRSLPNAIFGERAVSCLRRRSRNGSRLGRRARFAGRQRLGTNSSLAKYA
jgi:hypothetical protein